MNTVVAVDGVKNNQPRRRGIYVFARRPEACASLRRQLDHDAVRQEAWPPAVVVGAGLTGYGGRHLKVRDRYDVSGGQHEPNGGTYTYFVEAILVSEEGWPW